MTVSGNSQLALRLLLLISTLQAVALSGFAIFLVVELFIANPDSWASAIFLTLIALGFAGGLWAITRGLWQGRSPARSASLVWQVLQLALGLASDDGVFARFDIAAVLIVPAVVAMALLLFSTNLRRHFDEAADDAADQS